MDVLPDLSDSDLKEIGLPLGDRKRLLMAALRLEEPARRKSELTTSPKTEAERRQLTVMFCDLVGSTALSHQLDPEDLRDVNRAYQDACKAAIERYEGFVARYMGDGVLVYFGYPQAHEDDAERAIHSGLSVIDAMNELNETFSDKLKIELGVRVGIATGLVVVGDLIGEGASQESAVVGKTPNLAARLQGMADTNKIVIASSTYDLAGGRFEYKDLGINEVKGLPKPVRVWQVVAPSAVQSRFEARQGRTLTAFVGREPELQTLIHCWSQAKGGEGQVVLVSGEPGIGKSRLTEMLHEQLAKEPHIRLRYQCSSHYTNSALYPMIAQLTYAAGIAVDDPASRRLDKLEALLGRATGDVSAVAGLFADLLSISHEGRYAPRNLTPQAQKAQTLDALSNQLLGLAETQPHTVGFRGLALGRSDDPGTVGSDSRAHSGQGRFGNPDLPPGVSGALGRTIAGDVDGAKPPPSAREHRAGSQRCGRCGSGRSNAERSRGEGRWCAAVHGGVDALAS